MSLCKALINGYFSVYKTEKGSKSHNKITIIAGFASLGAILGHFLLTLKSDTRDIAAAFSILALGYLISLGIQNIYKYYFLVIFKDDLSEVYLSGKIKRK